MYNLRKKDNSLQESKYIFYEAVLETKQGLF